MNIPTHGRDVYYDIPDPNLPEISQWIIGNPNKINLARIALKFPNNTAIDSTSLTNIRQELHVYTGVITSTFIVLNKTVTVETRSDFDSDSVAISIKSDLIKNGQLQVYLDFPYPPVHSTTYKYEVFAGSYDFPTNHTTELVDTKSNGAHIYHQLQETKYFVNLGWSSSSGLSLKRDEPPSSTSVTAHRYTLSTAHRSASTIDFTAQFSLRKRTAASPSVIKRRNEKGWANYWEQGGFVDVTQSSNPAADELQRRIILSMYHVRVNSAGAEPPQESGLMTNGWYGKVLSFNILTFSLLAEAS